MLASVLFRRLMTTGTLRVVDAYGREYVYEGEPAEPVVTVWLHDPSLNHRLLFRPRLALGEAYMDGTLTVENGDTIYDLLALLMRNLRVADLGWLQGVARGFGTFMRRFTQHNPVTRARKNAAHHYDLSKTLYDLFLDKDLQYSCAYFRTGSETLDQAQEDKKLHIASKLRLSSRHRILDIGSGWGGLAAYLAELTGAEVMGITLSTEQLAVARERVRRAGLAQRVWFELMDYRQVEGVFDRIVSVGMFEHVGAPYYDVFFRKIRELLSDDGVALLHTIGRIDPPGTTNPWIRKYIFPGGYVPALSETVAAIERTGLFVTDIEILRLHYAETLRAWRRRFVANWERAAQIYDERFCRMWEFYLAASEAGFRHDGLVVFQIQLTKRVDSLPIVRDYMVDWERRMDRERHTEKDSAAA